MVRGVSGVGEVVLRTHVVSLSMLYYVVLCLIRYPFLLPPPLLLLRTRCGVQLLSPAVTRCSVLSPSTKVNGPLQFSFFLYCNSPSGSLHLQSYFLFKKRENVSQSHAVSRAPCTKQNKLFTGDGALPPLQFDSIRNTKSYFEKGTRWLTA